MTVLKEWPIRGGRTRRILCIDAADPEQKKRWKTEAGAPAIDHWWGWVHILADDDADVALNLVFCDCR